MKKTVLMLAALLVLSGCVHLPLHGIIPDNEYLTPEQKTYLQEIGKQPLRFDVPKAEALDAWGRAQAFVSQHSGMKIQTATDFVLETYNPTFMPTAPTMFGPPESLGTVTFGYKASRSPAGDMFQFDVNCYGPDLTTAGNIWPRDRELKNKQVEKTADRNARIMARFISTGKMEHPELIVK